MVHAALLVLMTLLSLMLIMAVSAVKAAILQDTGRQVGGAVGIAACAVHFSPLHSHRAGPR